MRRIGHDPHDHVLVHDDAEYPGHVRRKAIYGQDVLDLLGVRPRSADSPDPVRAGPLAYAFGFAFSLFLASMRTRFVWWPFHPVGYLVSGSFGLFRLWLPIFVTWLAKTLILRYGGLEWYRRARPFFFGLIFGEFLVAFVRTLVDLAFRLYLPPESGVGGL